MALKVNAGNSFIHPVTNQMIGPGQFYEDYEMPKKVELTEDNQDQDTNESIGGETDGQGETNPKDKKRGRGQRGTTDDK